MEETRRDNSGAMKAYVRNHWAVTLHHGGATLDGNAETVVRGLSIAEAPSLDVVRTFVADCPVGKVGLIAQFQMQPFNGLADSSG